jgi:hypothetical protein
LKKTKNKKTFVRGFVVPLAWINSSLGTDKGKMMMEQVLFVLLVSSHEANVLG